jgi:Family of unknown function (DUF5302)
MAAAQNPTSDPSASADPAPAEAGAPGANPSSADSSDSAGAQPAAGPPDVKARFRDALERKKSQHADGVGGSGPAAGKVSDVHARAGGKRQFRRKSGG